MNLSEPLRVTKQVRKVRVLSPYLFAVYFDYLFLELKNIKAGCYMVEILLNDLMFADDICVFWRSERGLQSIQYKMFVARLVQNCMKLVSTAEKLFVWRLRLWRQKGRSSRCWHWVYKEQNMLSTTKIWVLYEILSFQMTKIFRQERAYARGWGGGVKPPLSLIFYKKFLPSQGD